jgi:hypothetical protein
MQVTCLFSEFDCNVLLLLCESYKLVQIDETFKLIECCVVYNNYYRTVMNHKMQPNSTFASFNENNIIIFILNGNSCPDDCFNGART